MHLCSHFTSAAGIPLLGVGPEKKKVGEKMKKVIFLLKKMFENETLNTRAGGSGKMCKINIMKHLQ